MDMLKFLLWIAKNAIKLVWHVKFLVPLVRHVILLKIDFWQAAAAHAFQALLKQDYLQDFALNATIPVWPVQVLPQHNVYNATLH